MHAPLTVYLQLHSLSLSPAGICPKLPPGSASILSANVTETLTGLVKVDLKVNITKVRRNALHNPQLPLFHPCFVLTSTPLCYQPTAAGAIELRLICPPLVGSGMDVLLPKYFALLAILHH